jgi:hypothetical protein
MLHVESSGYYCLVIRNHNITVLYIIIVNCIGISTETQCREAHFVPLATLPIQRALVSIQAINIHKDKKLAIEYLQGYFKKARDQNVAVEALPPKYCR